MQEAKERNARTFTRLPIMFYIPNLKNAIHCLHLMKKDILLRDATKITLFYQMSIERIQNILY